MASLSIAIQHTPAYPERREWVRTMLRQLQEEGPDVPVRIIKDSKQHGCWPTYLRALKAASETSHHLILQDDVALCRDFIDSVLEVIESRPRNMIALFTNSRLVYTARNRGEAWIEKTRVPCPALVWPRALIGEFIAWQSAHVAQEFPWDDARISMWIANTSHRAFATVPSLAQHLGAHASTLGLNGSGKTASWYVGSNRSALGIDWTQGRRSPAKDQKKVQAECWQYFRE